jgi:hypothetical protein
MFNEEETERLQSALEQLADPLELTLFQKQENKSLSLPIPFFQNFIIYLV